MSHQPSFSFRLNFQIGRKQFTKPLKSHVLIPWNRRRTVWDEFTFYAMLLWIYWEKNCTNFLKMMKIQARRKRRSAIHAKTFRALETFWKIISRIRENCKLSKEDYFERWRFVFTVYSFRGTKIIREQFDNASCNYMYNYTMSSFKWETFELHRIGICKWVVI